MQSGLYGYTFPRLYRQQANSASYTVFYMLGAVTSLLYNIILLLSASRFTYSDDLVQTLIAVSIMVLCVHSIVTHILGIISSSKTQSEAACMIKFVRVSYWISFLAAIMGFVGNLIAFLKATDPKEKLFLYYGLFVIAFGLVWITLAWSAFVFCLFPEDPHMLFYYPVQSHNLKAPPQYQP